MKILITGASGFAGIHFLRSFLETNEHVSVYCPVTYTHGGNAQRFKLLLTGELLSRTQILKLDLTKSEFIEYFRDKKLDLIINFASESHVDNSIVKPLNFCRNNVDLMLNVLELTRICGARLLHISTDEVYGPISNNENNFEWQRDFRPSNPYSASKASQESLLISYFRTYKIDGTIINLTNLAGEAQNEEKFIPKSISRISRLESLQIDTDLDGNIGSRKYLDVKDMCQAIKLILSKTSQELRDLLEEDPELPLKFHISGTRQVSNDEVVKLISLELNMTPRIKFAPSPRVGYDLTYNLSMRNLTRLNWHPTENFEETIGRIVFFKLHHDVA